MDRGHRELLGRDRLVLDVRDRPGPPPLRFEATDDARRRLLRQGERPLLLGAATGDGCCRDLHLHRLAGYRSPLPPLRSAAMRSGVNQVHQYARWLEDAPQGPLCDGRWELSRRTVFAPGVWDVDLVRDWPGGCLELWCGGGWHGVLPLRELSTPDAPRVKAYRKHAREGTLAPVLLWWVSFLDGWAILDGHDRAVAALTEGRTPECVVLTRVVDEDTWRRQAAELTEECESRTAPLDARPHPGAARHRALMEEGFAHTLAELPYEASSTPSWPLPGGRADWDHLAAAAVFQFPSD
ncbi:hypothetical protein [Streptomyces olivochromogenes]|uniref:hypothetical protein n=1 Tax=Streptomyces olivochromogenes TaxID=1963 RepID=UPI001F2E427A|nr:hypothetical protein [Streptomyces olivochromogenes]MCF3134223.1 hypothetical protein [Streptomyces olivochromogenes]